MSQRFEDNIIKAITTSDVVLLKKTLENSEQTIHWNQTVDGLSVLALCIKYFHPEIFQILYTPSGHTLPDDLFIYIIEHAPKIVVDALSSNIIQTINHKLSHNDIWDDGNDAEQVLKVLRKSTHHITPLINHASCNLVEELLSSKIGPEYVSLLVIKAIESENPKLVDHAIEQIEQRESHNWCNLCYRDWSAAHVRKICQIYDAQSYPNLNRFLNKISEQTWHSLQKAHWKVMLYSTTALKDLLSDSGTNQIERFLQSAPQSALQRLSDEDVLKQLTAHELEMLLNAGRGCTIEQYEFLSRTPIRFEIPLILEQYRRIYCSKKDIRWSQEPDKEWRLFQRISAPLLSSVPYAFQEKRMDLEMYYKTIHGTSPNQSVSVLDCLHPEDRAWAEKYLLHKQLNDISQKAHKKSKI